MNLRGQRTSRWELPLPGLDPAQVRWEHLHAAVSTWLDDPSEHHAPDKAWSVSPPLDHGQGPVLEIGVADDALTERLAAHAHPGATLRLGRQVATLGIAKQVAAAPWAALAPTSGSPRAWCLRFASPVTFRRGNRFTPMPAVPSLLGSARRNWKRWAPNAYPIDLDLTHDPVWVTDIDGHNEVLIVGGRTVSGFVGRLRLECDAPDHVAATVDAVLGLAAYTGLGAWTARGFGLTRRDPTWAPR